MHPTVTLLEHRPTISHSVELHSYKCLPAVSKRIPHIVAYLARLPGKGANVRNVDASQNHQIILDLPQAFMTTKELVPPGVIRVIVLKQLLLEKTI